MARGMKNLVCYLVVVALAYVLLGVGEFVAAGASPTKLSINAFLFLMGLGGLIALLSPPSSLANTRKRLGS